MPKARHLIVAFAAILLLALPASASAAAKAGGKSVDRLAAQACAKERKQIGRSAFLKKYGERATTRACVRRTRNRVKAALRDASNECLAELAEIGPAEFAEDYGSDETGSDAYEECVELTVSVNLDPGDDPGEYEDEEEEE
jgi:transposase